MTCPPEEPCPVYLELSSVSSSGSRIFLAGNIHSPQTTLYSVLLRSDDRGAAWQEASDRVRGEELDHIQFQNLETGWVSGQRVVPLPGDPFFLITHDGGKSWRKAPVLPEGSPGFIQKFRFDSATSGKMVIDRGATEGDELQYRLYETKDGGDSWTVVESSEKPIKDAPVPEEDSVWRLRADKGGKTILVERRTADDKWSVAASFTIQIGTCREP
jgi:photosystem II stability/assembly factor-like uncharacterized protein